MDIVIPFVDCSDKEWIKLFRKTFPNRAVLRQRFRNYGTLKYLLRSIDKNVTFVDNVFIVVQSKSQIPKWLDTTKVNVVLHEDYIPKEYLPTYNSNTIEMRVYSIKDLGEQFLLCNDDMIFLKPQKKEWYFIGDKIVYNIKETTFNKGEGIFSNILNNNYEMFHRICKCNICYENMHMAYPFLKSVWEYVWNTYTDIMYSHYGAKLRSSNDLNQYLINYFQLYNGYTIHDESLTFDGYLALRDETTREQIRKVIRNNNAGCFNDNVLGNTQVFEWLREELDELFPEKSRFEKEVVEEKHKINVENPVTLTDKLQWLKIHDVTPLKTKCADKYLLHEYCKEKLGKDICVPILKTFDSADDIKDLPNSFVLKCNHGSKFNIVIKHEGYNLNKIKTKINEWMHTDFGSYTTERHYLNIKRKILLEPYLEVCRDYKFWCFNGEPRMFTAEPRRNHYNHYDLQCNKLDISRIEYPALDMPVELPNRLEEMISFSKKLSEDFKFVRVDFMVNRDELYLGELTFIPASGYLNYENPETDFMLGEWLKL